LTLAGYSETTDPASVLGSKAVQKAIAMGCEAKLSGPMLAKALRTMEELLDKKTPAATRFQAAKFIAERQQKAQGDDKPLSEMTEDELVAVIERAKKATARWSM
jgi:asparagine synthetase B (glutamine-hydrolysing)